MLKSHIPQLLTKKLANIQIQLTRFNILSHDCGNTATNQFQLAHPDSGRSSSDLLSQLVKGLKSTNLDLK